MKRGLFYTEGESDSKLSWLAAKIPKATRTGDLDKDNEAELQCAAYIRLVDGLWKALEHCMAVQQFFENRISKENVPTGSGEVLFETVTTLRALSEVWCAAWLCKAGKMEQKLVENFKDYDHDVVRQLMVFSLAANLALRLPEACRDQEVTTFVFNDRYERVGQRMEALKLTGAYDSRTYAIDWLRVGVYELRFGEDESKGYVTHVVHKPTKAIVALPSHVHIAPMYDLVDNFSDWTARAELKPNKYFLHDSFVKSQGPHSIPAWKGDSRSSRSWCRSKSRPSRLLGATRGSSKYSPLTSSWRSRPNARRMPPPRKPERR